MSGDKRITGFFVILLTIASWYMHEQEKTNFRLNEAPVALGTVQKRSAPYGKGRQTHYTTLLLLFTAPSAGSLVQVEIEPSLFEKLHPADTLAVRHIPGSSTAVLSPAAAPHSGRWLFELGLLYAGLLLPSRISWPIFRFSPVYLHSAVLLAGCGLLLWGLRSCIDWSSQNSWPSTYEQDTQITGRVLAVGPSDSAAAVLVAYRPIEEPLIFPPRQRWLPVAAVYRYTFEQAIQLQWHPTVEVWYPEHEQENAQLVVQPRPKSASRSGLPGFLGLVAGLFLLLSQIGPLETALKNNFRRRNEE